MKRFPFALAPFTAFLLVACSSAGEPTPEDEDIAAESAALQNSGGSVASRCNSTTCPGCKLVYVGKTDTGCRQYQCQCDTEEGAKCVTGTKATAGRVGAIMSISSPGRSAP